MLCGSCDCAGLRMNRKAKRARFATSSPIISHSMWSIVAFHGLAILCTSMGEGMEDPSKMTRRGFMAGTVATLAAAAVPEAAVAADSPDKTKAGQEGPEHMLHAFREYQRHDTNGLLEKNFSDYQKNVKDESNAIHLKKKDADLGQFKVGRMALEVQRDGYLAEFDKILIPKLLALYIQNDLQDKSLVRSYKPLFTNPDE